MMQLMAWIRYNRIKQFETPINSNITDSLLINFTGSPQKKDPKGHPVPPWKLSPFGPPPLRISIAPRGEEGLDIFWDYTKLVHSFYYL